jgi:hypothetical protein
LYLEMNYNQNLQDYLQELHTPPGQRTKDKNDFDIGVTVGKRKETPIKLDKSSTNDHEKVSTVSSVYSNNNRRNLEPALRKNHQRPPTGLPAPMALYKKDLKYTNSINYSDLDRRRDSQTLRSEQSTDGPPLETHPSYYSEKNHKSQDQNLSPTQNPKTRSESSQPSNLPSKNPSPPPKTLKFTNNNTEEIQRQRSEIFSKKPLPNPQNPPKNSPKKYNYSHNSTLSCYEVDPTGGAYSESTSNCLFSRLHNDETSKTYLLEGSEREIPRFAQELKKEEELLEKKIKELKKNKAKLRFKYMKVRELVEKGC